MENHTAKHFVLQLGSLVSLYLSLSFLLVLVFGLVNLIFPDAIDTIWEIESASQMVRLGISMTLVFFPTYVILTRLVNKSRRQSNEHSYLSLTKWLIYFSLLIGGATLLIDLVVVINTFLNGEITARFIYKALAVLIVIGAAFYYYLLDARGFWIKNEKKSIIYGAVAAVVALLAVILGFMNIQAPTEVREQKLDQIQITDLQQIQWQIQDYLILNGNLPESLDVLNENNKVTLPSAPAERNAYRYELTKRGFQLCATFVMPSRSDEYLYSRQFAPATEMPTILNPDTWEHGEGEVCFERIVITKSE